MKKYESFTMAVSLFLLSLISKLDIFGVGGIKQDINMLILAFKLVILLFIISFVRSRFGGGPIVSIMVFLLAYIMLFTNYFYIFGPAMFIYFFIIFGFISILFDLSIAKPWKKMNLGPDTTSKEAGERIERARSLRRGLYG